MDLEVKQENISKAINNVGRIVSSRTTLPVLGNILITAQKGKITLSATDLEVATSSKVVGKVIDEGSITVPARLLSDFVLNNNDETLSLKLKDLTLNLKSKRFNANIKGINSEEFPSIPQKPKDIFCKIPVNILIDALKKVVLAAANDETRPTLAGVYMKFKDKTLIMAATDSYRLAEIKVDLKDKVDEKEVIIPAKTLNEVLRIASSKKGDEEVEIFVDDNQVFMAISDVEIVSRLIEGSFPNYEQIIPKNQKISTESDVHETLNALKMSALFSKDVANNIKIEVVDGKILIKSYAQEIGDTTSEIAAKTEGGTIEVAFNARYLIDVLGVISGEKIKMSFNDDSSPCVIKADEEKNYIYLVMPLKSEG